MKTELITGLIASICTAASMLPQLIKLLKEKKSQDISMVMLLVLLIGLSCWIAYGIMKKDWILIAANSFSWIVTLLMIVFTIRYK